MSTVMNAFHPDYIKTYHPELLKSLRTNSGSSQRQTGVVEKARKANKSYGTVHGLSKKSLEPLNFFIYSRAGTK